MLFISTLNTEAEGSRFTRGSNRIARFVGWQAVAGIVSLVVLRYAKLFRTETLAWRLFRLPIARTGLLVAFMIVLIVVCVVNTL